MKFKFKYIFFLSLLFLFLTSCDYVQFDKTKEQDQELLEARSQYIEELNGLSKLENYREAEQRIYTLALQEAINQINDCQDKTLLIEIYEQNKEIILSIKLDETYCLEEEQLKQEYIQKLKDLSNTDRYLEKEKESYLYYLNLGIEALEKNTDPQNLDSIYKAYEERITEIKTLEKYVNEWHLDFCLEIDDYIDLSVYRQFEADSISKLILECKENILDTDDYQTMDSIVRDFKIKVYSYATAEELYAEELETLKQESIIEVQMYKTLDDYRDNEKLIIQNLLDTYKSMLQNFETKEQVYRLTEVYKINLDSIKTDTILYEEERMVLVNEGYEELYNLIDITDKADDFVQWYTNYCQEIKEELIALSTKQEVSLRLSSAKELLYIQGAKEGDLNSLRHYKNVVIERIEQYLDMSLYREEQQIESKMLILSWSSDLREIEDFDSIVREVQNIEQQLDEIPTNEELWLAEDEFFVIHMQEKYKGQLLQFPDNLFEANDLYELAKILDYYAFYQIDGTSFERSKFRVHLNFEHKDAKFVKNEVYWYCELLRSTIGLDVSFEDEDYFVVEYIPYNFASVDNWAVNTKLLERKNYLMQINEGTFGSKRSADFDDFVYYENTKQILVWNTQQLWYALQYEYIPICVPGSIAERTLNKAKEILREIVTDEMTLEEKIFSIFTWFGQNVQYDRHMEDYNYSSDMYSYPDENTSQLKSFFAEGAILDNLAVCSGYAKAYLIMLRIEGIKSFRILARAGILMGKNTINARDDGVGYGYGSHEFVYVQIGDKWYYSDPERSATEVDQTLQSYLYCLLPPENQNYGFSVLFPNLEWGEDIPEIYKQINIMGVNNFATSFNDVDRLISLISEKEDKYLITILYNSNEYKDCYDDVCDRLSENMKVFLIKLKSCHEIFIYN